MTSKDNDRKEDSSERKATQLESSTKKNKRFELLGGSPSPEASPAPIERISSETFAAASSLALVRQDGVRSSWENFLLFLAQSSLFHGFSNTCLFRPQQPRFHLYIFFFRRMLGLTFLSFF